MPLALPAGFAAQIAGQLDGLPAREIFFRADDIGVPSRNFSRLLSLFITHQLPLCLAVVPCWLTVARWRQIAHEAGDHEKLWCWHQHGWRHKNHETAGKKCEFGAHRKKDLMQSELCRGRARLENLLGESFTPVLTPPWNRIADGVAELARHCKLRAISTSGVGLKRIPGSIPDFSVNVDLHTRKEKTGGRKVIGITNDFASAVADGRIGVMIHHQHMAEEDFNFLDGLLALVTGQPGFIPVTFANLLNQTNPGN
ncbi:MAG: hypothetical protein N839_0002910 [Desulfofustis sp. PB-SRB1]|jgi:hypothetical protein|nr:hypothetical protein [Desulfofustis sp. PB-SRB1]MBM1001341.1 hypothetical protein [Desulfofustis sp. PB-SRB1]HBH29680.1 polysaccharide deacetylase [Desulfofustis sp.]HBH31978.1 polysaccharide deacetylase [Desulfofustis sp.]